MRIIMPEGSIAIYLSISLNSLPFAIINIMLVRIGVYAARKVYLQIYYHLLIATHIKRKFSHEQSSGFPSYPILTFLSLESLLNGL